ANRRSSPVQAVRTAITLLGLKRVASIAVGVACRSLFDVEVRVQHELLPGWWERLFHCAMTEAFAASFVAMEHNRAASDGIFLAAMLHDIGKSLALRSLAALTISGQVQALPEDETIEELLRRLRVPVGVAALTALNMPENLVVLCGHQDDEDLPETKEWTDVHVVRLVSALNDLRLATLNTEQPIRFLLGAVRSMHLSPDAVVAIARQVSEHAAQVGLLFSTTDGAEEIGYLDFVARCVQQANEKS
ncbi:MAG TPA: HDOD domain-containing protein, partial [Polyangiaceae bacterium]|nr:HDOD domain-containing protein [Polyangiaceae bacterium]